MIFHASIPANDPKHVAHVLAELWDGFAAPFSPFPDAWMAVAGDDRGSIIEVYPSDQVITPGGGHEESVSYGANTLKRPQYSAFHMAIATKLSAEDVIAIGEREGWRAVPCSRGGVFDVVELRLENGMMFEVLTPEMQHDYRTGVTMDMWRLNRREAAAPA